VLKLLSELAYYWKSTKNVTLPPSGSDTLTAGAKH